MAMVINGNGVGLSGGQSRGIQSFVFILFLCLFTSGVGARQEADKLIKSEDWERGGFHSWAEWWWWWRGRHSGAGDGGSSSMHRHSCCLLV